MNPNSIPVYSLIFPIIPSSSRGEGGQNEPGYVYQNEKPRDKKSRDDGEGAVEAVSPVPILGGGDPTLPHNDSLIISYLYFFSAKIERTKQCSTKIKSVNPKIPKQQKKAYKKPNYSNPEAKPWEGD